MQTPELTLQRGDRIKIVDDEGNEICEGLYIGQGRTGDVILVPMSEAVAPPAKDAAFRGQCRIDGEMTTFASKLLEIFDHPLTLWRIQTPTDAQTFELRDNERTRCTVSATVEATHEGLVLVGIIRDISKSGARCVFTPAKTATASLDVDVPVTLRCEFPGIPGEQVTQAKITDVTESESEFSVGIRFLESAWWVPPYH